jgi:hypothetical protein
VSDAPRVLPPPGLLFSLTSGQLGRELDGGEMAHAARQPPRPRPPAKTPAQRAEEAAAVQRRLKQEAAERRNAAESSKKR